MSEQNIIPSAPPLYPSLGENVGDYRLKNNTQTAVINIINLRIIFKLDVSYASQHTFSKVTVTNF